jgi:hypothetical protein
MSKLSDTMRYVYYLLYDDKIYFTKYNDPETVYSYISRTFYSMFYEQL